MPEQADEDFLCRRLACATWPKETKNLALLDAEGDSDYCLLLRACIGEAQIIDGDHRCLTIQQGRTRKTRDCRLGCVLR
jgi:hypothetical protein